jgi:AcrR family transcriptional regulator
MRIKDETKRNALFEATVKLVNEVGFVASSVSKIAKEANVSPATIYIYHDNKENLLISTYIEIKMGFSEALLDGFDESMPIRDIFRKIWRNGFRYVSKHRNYIQFTEQFANTPLYDMINKEEVEAYYRPIIEIAMKGIEQKIIKNISVDLFGAFMFFPMMTLTNPRLCHGFTITDDNIETSFTLAWDAIKL